MLNLTQYYIKHILNIQSQMPCNIYEFYRIQFLKFILSVKLNHIRFKVYIYIFFYNQNFCSYNARVTP